MTDLLSAAQKANIHGVFDDLHDTFARDVVFYVSEEGTFVDTDGNHNPLYGRPEEERQLELIPHTKKVRIKYLSSTDRAFGVTDAQLNLSFPKGAIRLKVDAETYQILVTSKKIKVDDCLCELASMASRPGPFNPNYWTVYLKRLD
jgi:hypothetical protein